MFIPLSESHRSGLQNAMLFKRPNMNDFKHCFYSEESCITLPGLGRLTDANLPQPCPIIQVQRSLHPDEGLRPLAVDVVFYR